MGYIDRQKCSGLQVGAGNIKCSKKLCANLVRLERAGAKLDDARALIAGRREHRTEIQIVRDDDMIIIPAHEVRVGSILAADRSPMHGIMSGLPQIITPDR